MFEGLSYVEFSGEKLPIKCDMVVLEKIQDKYENLSKYENMLSGFVPSTDENGEVIRNEEGHMVGTYEIPKIAVLKEALLWMVQEGMEIEAEKNGDKFKGINENTVFRKVDISPQALGQLLHKEFARCFERKNAKTA